MNNLIVPLLLGFIMAVMFGWEIGFGVALFVAAVNLFIAGQPIWGTLTLTLALALGADSLRRLHKVVIYAGPLEVNHFTREEKALFPQRHDYQFSGMIEIRVPSEVAIRHLYLELQGEGTKTKVELMADLNGELTIGSILSPSRPLFKNVGFQLLTNTPLDPIPKTGTIMLLTTGWKRRKVVELRPPI